MSDHERGVIHRRSSAFCPITAVGVMNARGRATPTALRWPNGDTALPSGTSRPAVSPPPPADPHGDGTGWGGAAGIFLQTAGKRHVADCHRVTRGWQRYRSL